MDSDLLRCNSCDFESEDSDELAMHLQESTTCNLALKSSEEDSIIEEKQSFSCQLCDFVTTTNFAFKQHRMHKHRTKPSANKKCGDCDYVGSAVGLSNHNRYIAAKGRILQTCEVCEFKACYPKQMQDHVINNHPENDTFQPLKMKCELCDFETHDRSYLYKHNGLWKKSGRSSPYKCEYCNFKGCIKAQVKTHHRKEHPTIFHDFSNIIKKVPKPEHKPKGSVKCENCDYVSNEQGIRFHKANWEKVGKPAPFVCDICQYKSCTTRKLTDHLAQVHGKYPMHKCEFCDYQTTIKSLFEAHNAYREPWFASSENCLKCQKKFCSNQALQRHIQYIHPEKVLKVKPAKLAKSAKPGEVTYVKCQNCDYQSCEAGISLHLSSWKKAGNPEPQKCEICDYKSCTTRKLRDHMSKAHGKGLTSKPNPKPKSKQNRSENDTPHGSYGLNRKNGKYACSGCNFVTKYPQNLTRHMNNQGCEYSKFNESKVSTNRSPQEKVYHVLPRPLPGKWVVVLEDINEW